MVPQMLEAQGLIPAPWEQVLRETMAARPAVREHNRILFLAVVVVAAACLAAAAAKRVMGKERAVAAAARLTLIQRQLQPPQPLEVEQLRVIIATSIIPAQKVL